MIWQHGRLERRGRADPHLVRLFLGDKVCFMATAPATRVHHPPVVNLPNGLTFARLILAVVLFGCIAWECWLTALVVFAVAAFTDWLDGYLARKQGLTSAFGRNFDPLVDKVLI